VYEQLRRVEISLVRNRTETEPYVEETAARPGRELLGGCPDDVVRQAFPQGGGNR
jgi:hypothetical protein